MKELIKFLVGDNIWNAAQELRHNGGKGICFDPVSLVIASVVAAGATAYSATKESASAKKAAEAQKEVGLAQIAASQESTKLATQEAQAKLKLKQASKSNNILTSPMGVEENANTNTKSILGVA